MESRAVDASNDETIIHIQWEGPHSLDAVKGLTGPTDYGVYQIYGGHPVYGNSALLYIGLADKQKFGVRIPQEKLWLYNRDAGRVDVYVGRLSGYGYTPSADIWSEQIKLAERLLIHAHAPPYNGQKGLVRLNRRLWSVHLLNWGQHRDLLPEVSGARWTSRFGAAEGYRAFSVK